MNDPIRSEKKQQYAQQITRKILAQFRQQSSLSSRKLTSRVLPTHLQAALVCFRGLLLPSVQLCRLPRRPMSIPQLPEAVKGRWPHSGNDMPHTRHCMICQALHACSMLEKQLLLQELQGQSDANVFLLECRMWLQPGTTRWRPSARTLNSCAP